MGKTKIDETGKSTHFWGYAGRFILLHPAAYTIIGGLFLLVQSRVPEAHRVALDFEYFSPYRTPGLITLAAQALRALILAFIFYPFYRTITSSSLGSLPLFGAMWGVAVFGSVEPIPGSLEGMVYTITTLPEHIAVLGATAMQTALFVWLFLRWERARTELGNNSAGDSQENTGPVESGKNGLPNAPISKRGHVLRFSLLHLLTYWTVGSLFYQISDYQEAMASMEIFELYRPLESLVMVFGVFFGQIVRGPLLALLLFPFLATWVHKRHGWLLLFGLLFGLTALGSPVFLHLTIEDTLTAASFRQFIEGWTVGVPEIFTQMLLFSILLFLWERKRFYAHLTA
ncbi:MAG: hypothetical protein ACLFQW_10925 [Spirochaetaceae bacterium]